MWLKYRLVFCIALLFIIIDFLDNEAFAQDIKLNITPGYIVPLNEPVKDYSYGLYIQTNATCKISEITDIYLLLRYQRFFYKEKDFIEDYNIYNILYGLGSKFYLINKAAKPYLGIEVSLGTKYFRMKLKNVSFSSTYTDGPFIIIAPNIGYTYPISESLIIEPNIKFSHQLGTTEINCLFFGVGVTY